MFKNKWIAALALLIFAVHPSSADDSSKAIGIWKLVSFETEFQATGERRPLMGKSPVGYAIFTPEKRVMFFIEGEGRKAPQTNEDRIVLHQTMIAYTGMYRFEDDKFITKVDASWNPAWTGTDQVRFFKLEGDRLHIISAWAPNPLLPDRPVTRGYLTWERWK